MDSPKYEEGMKSTSEPSVLVKFIQLYFEKMLTFYIPTKGHLFYCF